MVNIYKPELTNLQQGILRLMYKKVGKSLNARTIAKTLEVSQPAVSKALPGLEKKALINIEKNKESKQLSISLNTNNHQLIWLKKADNIKQIYESELVQFLYEKAQDATIILFGSYSLGEDTITSDIDLAIIGKPQDLKLKKFEKILERKINVNYYKSFKNINRHLLNNILNGILLKGSVNL